MRKGSLRRRLAGLLVLASLVAPVVASSQRPVPILVAVRATSAEATLLSERGFDLVEMRDGDEVQIVLWSGDAARLAALGFEHRVLDVDLLAEHASAMLPDRTVVPTGPATETPRTTYRTLADHHAELRALASNHPQLVQVLDLGRSLEGREIIGIRVAIGNADDGRPHAYLDGVHHAREWPSAEYVTGFAHRLVSDALSGEPRVSDLLRRLAVILVPVMNPDGFTISRSAPHDGNENVFAAAGVAAYWRKNARGAHHDAALHVSLGSYGVDPNRNYPFAWGTGTPAGGNGASGNPADQTFEGEAPHSEPEVAAVRDFVLHRNITGLITNHTFGNLVLYPWGHTSAPSPDHALFVALAGQLADANRYTPQPGIDLYATTGTMDDWAYAATGVLGFTFEHGTAFHPLYGSVGLKRAWNEESFLRLLTAAADPTKHSVISGKVVDGRGIGVRATLRLTKSADIPLDAGTSRENIDITMQTASDGTFSWHVNPSTGPIDADDYVLTATTAAGATATRIVKLARGGARVYPALTVA
jgi:hypothetical protein